MIAATRTSFGHVDLEVRAFARLDGQAPRRRPFRDSADADSLRLLGEARCRDQRHAIPAAPSAWRVILRIDILLKSRMQPGGDTLTTPPAEVIPARHYGFYCADKISLHQGAQGLRHLWPHAEPALEPADRLVQQHPETVDRAEPARPCGGKQRGLERRIDEIGSPPHWPAAGEIDAQGRLAGHAERGGVHEQTRFGHQPVEIAPARRLHPVAELRPAARPHDRRCG